MFSNDMCPDYTAEYYAIMNKLKEMDIETRNNLCGVLGIDPDSHLFKEERRAQHVPAGLSGECVKVLQTGAGTLILNSGIAVSVEEK